MDIAVERRADDIGLAVDHRRSRIAADDVIGGDIVIGHIGVELRLVGDERGRQVERRCPRRAIVNPAHQGARRDHLAALHPARDLAIADAQRERRVGIQRVAISGEARIGDLAPGCSDRPGILLVGERNHLAVARIESPRQPDHRVGRGIDRSLPAIPQRPAIGRVAQLRSRDQPRRHRLGRFATQQQLHIGIVGAQIFARLRQVKFQLQLIDPRRHRGRVKQLLLEQRQRAVAITGKPLAIGLGPLGRRPHQRRRIAEQVAARAQEAPRQIDVAIGRDRLFRIGPRITDPRLADRARAKIGLGRRHPGRQRGVVERLHPTDIDFEAILDPVEILLALARPLRALRHGRDEAPAKLAEQQRIHRRADFA